MSFMLDQGLMEGKAFTHPCIPNFNIAKDLPNHGPARKENVGTIR